MATPAPSSTAPRRRPLRPRRPPPAPPAPRAAVHSPPPPFPPSPNPAPLPPLDPPAPDLPHGPWVLLPDVLGRRRRGRGARRGRARSCVAGPQHQIWRLVDAQSPGTAPPRLLPPVGLRGTALLLGPGGLRRLQAALSATGGNGEVRAPCRPSPPAGSGPRRHYGCRSPQPTPARDLPAATSHHLPGGSPGACLGPAGRGRLPHRAKPPPLAQALAAQAIQARTAPPRRQVLQLHGEGSRPGELRLQILLHQLRQRLPPPQGLPFPALGGLGEAPSLSATETSQPLRGASAPC